MEGRVGMEGLDGRMDGMTNKAISQYRNYINSPACLAYLIIKTDFTHDGLNYCEAKTKDKDKNKEKGEFWQYKVTTVQNQRHIHDHLPGIAH